jgi:hypothetical protein
MRIFYAAYAHAGMNVSRGSSLLLRSGLPAARKLFGNRLYTYRSLFPRCTAHTRAILPFIPIVARWSLAAHMQRRRIAAREAEQS